MVGTFWAVSTARIIRTINWVLFRAKCFWSREQVNVRLYSNGYFTVSALWVGKLSRRNRKIQTDKFVPTFMHRLPRKLVKIVN